MTGTEIIKTILEREHLSPTKVSVEMGHGRAYLNTLINQGRECKESTLVRFLEVTGYEGVVRSKEDGFELILG